MSKRTALVTGASRGIGFAIAKKFADCDHNVIITGRNEEALKKACEKIGENARWMVWDVGDVDHAREYIDKAASIFGRLDVLVNNAGNLSDGDLANDFFQITPEKWDFVERVNLRGVFFSCQAAASYMIENKVHGHIVNVCSEMGFRPAWYTYSITKWGVRGMTYGLGRALAEHGIVVNGIAPGHTATSLVNWHEGDSLELAEIPRGRMAKPEEHAELVFFLASEAADNIMGEVVISDGARHLY